MEIEGTPYVAACRCDCHEKLRDEMPFRTMVPKEDARELVRQILMDAKYECDQPGTCNCSAARGARFVKHG